MADWLVPLCLRGGDGKESWHLAPEPVLLTMALQSGWRSRGGPEGPVRSREGFFLEDVTERELSGRSLEAA